MIQKRNSFRVEGAGVRDAFPPPIVVCGDCLRVSFGWMISFGRIVRGCITEFGRGGACVPARVALQGRIRRSSPAHNASIFGMETPLRERSGGHAGTAPTASFGWIVRKRLMSLGWIARKWLFGLCGIAWKNMMEVGRGGAYVPARVAQQGRIRRSSSAHNACVFGMETPLRGRSGGHTGAAPTHFA